MALEVQRSMSWVIHVVTIKYKLFKHINGLLKLFI